MRERSKAPGPLTFQELAITLGAVGINRCDTAPTPTGLAEIVSDYFPVLHVMSSVGSFP
jgi:hypothetical protein